LAKPQNLYTNAIFRYDKIPLSSTVVFKTAKTHSSFSFENSEEHKHTSHGKRGRKGDHSKTSQHVFDENEMLVVDLPERICGFEALRA